METKLLEIRDAGTFMPCLAIKLSFTSDAEKWLLNRAGFKLGPFILFHPLCTSEINYDIYNWNRGARTVPIAHKYVENNWEEIKSGDLIDVQYILGETKIKKESERI